MSREAMFREFSSPSPSLESWVRDQVGPVVEFISRSGPGTSSRVWEVRLADGEVCFLREHTQIRKFRQELRAYQDWLGRLVGSVPRLLGSTGGETPQTDSAQPLALLTTRSPGDVVATMELSPHEEGEAFEQAGRFLRALHDLEVGDCDPVGLDEALRQRLESWCQRGTGILTPDERDWALQRFGDGQAFRGLSRVVCHRDFQPGNWMFDPRGDHFEVIDFEHTGPDFWLVDVLKLWDGPWVQREDLEDRFWEGYGRRLGDDDRSRLELLAILHAVATVVWGGEHRDAVFLEHGGLEHGFLEHGRALLRRLGAPTP
jgi:aminoglycoside phosphotransferase (APT) family kinase protein